MRNFDHGSQFPANFPNLANFSQAEKSQLDLMARYYGISYAEICLNLCENYLGDAVNRHFDYLMEHNTHFSDFVEIRGGENA